MNEHINKPNSNEKVKCVALGQDAIDAEVVEVVDDFPSTEKERLDMLEQRIFYLTNSLDSLFSMVKQLRDDLNVDKDRNINDIITRKKSESKIEIPEGTVLTGQSKGVSYFLQVKDGGFYVGVNRYDSLSAAAEAVSGVRRSGWTFWKLPDGRTVKEAFKES